MRPRTGRVEGGVPRPQGRRWGPIGGEDRGSLQGVRGAHRGERESGIDDAHSVGCERTSATMTSPLRTASSIPAKGCIVIHASSVLWRAAVAL